MFQKQNLKDRTGIPCKVFAFPMDCWVRTVVTVAVNTDSIVIPITIHINPYIRACRERGVVSPYLKGIFKIICKLKFGFVTVRKLASSRCVQWKIYGVALHRLETKQNFRCFAPSIRQLKLTVFVTFFCILNKDEHGHHYRPHTKVCGKVMFWVCL